MSPKYIYSTFFFSKRKNTNKRDVLNNYKLVWFFLVFSAMDCTKILPNLSYLYKLKAHTSTNLKQEKVVNFTHSTLKITHSFQNWSFFCGSSMLLTLAFWQAPM